MGNKGGKSKKKDKTILTELDCPKGELDRKKFTEVYKEFYPQGKAEKFAHEVFKLFDTDGSGKIDFQEFLVAVSITSSNDIRKKLQLAFDLYDKNDNGRIDKKEMEKMLVSIYDLMGETNRKGDNDPKQRVEAIFRKMDRNYSNTLDEQEFIEGCLSDPILMRLLNPQI